MSEQLSCKGVASVRLAKVLMKRLTGPRAGISSREYPAFPSLSYFLRFSGQKRTS